MRIFRLKIKVNGKNEIVNVNSINMVQLVASCERNGVEYQVKFICKL